MPSTPTLTEKNLTDQSGKVFIVTGSTSGVGEELAQILYGKNAKVYVAARSAEKAQTSIAAMKAKHPSCTGELIFLRLDLDDLTTIKASAEEFLAKESKLDVLWNNAGVMTPPQGSKTKQGYELQLGTNNVAPFLFTKLLTPILTKTAGDAPAGNVRVVWVSSSASDLMAPTNGVDMENLDYKTDKGAWHKYGASKAGNVLHSNEFARRYGEQGVISVALDPGNLKSGLQRHMPGWQAGILKFFLKDPIYGAYTELFAGLSPDVTAKNNGGFIRPWGKIDAARKDIQPSATTGVAEQFWEWSEKQVAQYA